MSEPDKSEYYVSSENAFRHKCLMRDGDLVDQFELEKIAKRLNEGNQPAAMEAAWTDYHRVPVTKEDEAAAWKAVAVEGTGERRDCASRGGEYQYAAIHRNRSGQDAGCIDYTCRVSAIEELHQTEKADIVKTADALAASVRRAAGLEPAPAPPAEWKVVQRKDTAEWILEIAGPKLATQAEAEAAAAKVNGTCHHISTLQREHKQMAAEISRLQAELAAAENPTYVMCGKIAMLVSQDGASVAECEAAARDIQAMAAVRKYSLTVNLRCGEWGAIDDYGSYRDKSKLGCHYADDPTDAILSLAAELERSETK